MKKYITAVVVSAGLALGTLPAVAQQDTTQNQNQKVNTTQNMPSQTLPGRAYDRAALPGETPPNNPASGYAANEPAGGGLTMESLRATADNPSTFVPKAYEADQAEIRMGQLAQEKSSSEQVKSFANRIVQDHQAHLQKVQQLAHQKNIQVSDQLAPHDQKQYDRLSAMNGASFDRAFVQDMVRDHKHAIALYSEAAQNDTDSDVKALAQNTLPTLREHLQMAENDSTTINEPAGAGMQK